MHNDDLYQLETLEVDYLPVLKAKCNLFLKMLNGKKILEVGCGTGNLLRLLSNNNLDLSGTDYSSDYLAYAKNKSPTINFFQGDLLEPYLWKKYENSYDSIICSEVLEHITNDLAALKIIFSILKPNGTLIVTVPALNSLYSDFDKKIGHHRRYSKKSISDVIKEAGFTIEKARYWNFLGMFGWFILFRLLKQDIKKTSHPILGKLLGTWLKLESKLTFPLGQTIIVHAQKSHKADLSQK
jgi:ubiquinone/menaquinone biosynthesis C-methylase UbiE